MKTILSPLAKKQLKKLPKIVQFLVAKKVRSLLPGSEFLSTKLLTGYKNIYRIRVGNYRLVYRILDKNIYIVLISHRKDVYLLLKRILS